MAHTINIPTVHCTRQIESFCHICHATTTVAIQFLWKHSECHIMLVRESTHQHYSCMKYLNNFVVNILKYLIIYISLLGSRWLSCCVCICFGIVSHITSHKFLTLNGNQPFQSPHTLKHEIHLKSKPYLLIAFRTYWIASITPLNLSSYKIWLKNWSLW